jgi:hypothetical protein
VGLIFQDLTENCVHVDVVKLCLQYVLKRSHRALSETVVFVVHVFGVVETFFLISF